MATKRSLIHQEELKYQYYYNNKLIRCVETTHVNPIKINGEEWLSMKIETKRMLLEVNENEKVLFDSQIDFIELIVRAPKDFTEYHQAIVDLLVKHRFDHKK